MTTKAKQTPSEQNAKRNNLLQLVSILFAVSSLLLALVAIQLVNLNGKSDSFNATAIQSKQVRYAFCHDERITPCTDAAIEKWNQQNPDKAFQL